MKHRSVKKRLVALATTVMTLVMCMAGTMSASAVDPSATSTSFKFNKYLVMDENANVPNVTFTFIIEPDDSITSGTSGVANGNILPIYAGIAPTNGTATAQFSASDSTTSGKPDDPDAVGFQYATEEVTFDFSGVSFNAPGIYRYIITEKSATPGNGITNDTIGTRTLDVYVEYKNTGTEQAPVYSDTELVIMGYNMYSSVDNSDLTAGKSDSFTNEYTTYDLTLEKQVTGNQGDRNKYFAFTVNITDAVPGTVYDVDLTDASWNGSPANPTELTVTGDGTVSGTFYLNDNDKIIIQGLTSGTKYTITENDYTSEGYTTTNTDNNGASADGTTTTEKAITSDHPVTFTNHKQGNVPTGILLETAPYIILGVVVIAGFVVLFATRRRRSR